MKGTETANKLKGTETAIKLKGTETKSKLKGAETTDNNQAKAKATSRGAKGGSKKSIPRQDGLGHVAPTPFTPVSTASPSIILLRRRRHETRVRVQNLGFRGRSLYTMPTNFLLVGALLFRLLLRGRAQEATCLPIRWEGGGTRRSLETIDDYPYICSASLVWNLVLAPSTAVSS